MNDSSLRDEKNARNKCEALSVSNRLRELYENPLPGDFDLAHLQAIHAYLFQDLPEHRPGIIRERTVEAWVKHRTPEGQSVTYDVHYARDNIAEILAESLREFGGPDALKGLSPVVAAERLANLYGDLDYAHGFYEGNSRTLREFMRELALSAGYRLDWTRSDVSAADRNALYAARDLLVLERAFPDLTPERAMQTTDRVEYETSFVLDALRRAVGNKTLAALIEAGLSLLEE